MENKLFEEFTYQIAIEGFSTEVNWLLENLDRLKDTFKVSLEDITWEYIYKAPESGKKCIFRYLKEPFNSYYHLFERNPPLLKFLPAWVEVYDTGKDTFEPYLIIFNSPFYNTGTNTRMIVTASEHPDRTNGMYTHSELKIKDVRNYTDGKVAGAKRLALKDIPGDLKKVLIRDLKEALQNRVLTYIVEFNRLL